MDNQKQYIDPEEQEEESHIDFKALFAALKKRRKLYWRVLPITFIIACVIVLSIPNYYTCEVQLAPELATRGSSSPLGALASQLGFGGSATGSDALFPTLYPDLVNSTDFKLSLFDIPVHKKDSVRIMSYYDYLKNEQIVPWWSTAIGGTVRFLMSFLPVGEIIDEDKIDPFQLTKLQTKIVNSLAEKVVCDVDDKTFVITITVTDQDPLICATMADSVQARLQDFITDYRTKKARIDLEYNRKLYDEAKNRYDVSRDKYASYADANQDLIYQSSRTKLNDLENEMQRNYNAYNTVARQLIAAEAKVQEETPSFTTLQSATVPVQKAGPHRTKIVLVVLFLAFLCTSAWILYKEDQLKPLLGLS